MNPKINFLISLFEENDFRHESGTVQKLTLNHINKAGFLGEIDTVYRSLGGLEVNFPMNPRPFDIELNGIALILDEAEHFNRYRGLTFSSSFYVKVPSFPLENYKRYCRQYEGDCLKMASHSLKWKNPESEKYFGKSDEHGDLGPLGSSAWKYRAFQDYLADVSAIATNVKVIRLSIYDNIMIQGKLHKLQNLLISHTSNTKDYVWKYVKRLIEKS